MLRPSPAGELLCNACGIRWKRAYKRSPQRALQRAAELSLLVPPPPPPPPQLCHQPPPADPSVLTPEDLIGARILSMLRTQEGGAAWSGSVLPVLAA